MVKDHNTLVKHLRKKHSKADILFKCRYCDTIVEGVKNYKEHIPLCAASQGSLAATSSVPRPPIIITVTDFDMIPNRDLEESDLSDRK